MPLAKRVGGRDGQSSGIHPLRSRMLQRPPSIGSHEFGPCRDGKQAFGGLVLKQTLFDPPDATLSTTSRRPVSEQSTFGSPVGVADGLPPEASFTPEAAVPPWWAAKPGWAGPQRWSGEGRRSRQHVVRTLLSATPQTGHGRQEAGTVAHIVIRTIPYGL